MHDWKILTEPLDDDTSRGKRLKYETISSRYLCALTFIYVFAYIYVGIRVCMSSNIVSPLRERKRNGCVPQLLSFFISFFDGGLIYSREIVALVNFTRHVYFIRWHFYEPPLPFLCLPLVSYLLFYLTNRTNWAISVHRSGFFFSFPFLFTSYHIRTINFTRVDGYIRKFGVGSVHAWYTR